MSVLLSDEQINEAWPDDVFSVNDLYSDILQHVKVVCAAQLKAAIEWLEQPCTEHPIGEYHCGKPEPKEPVVKWVYKLGFLYLHRRDCPVCWAELKGEL